MKFATETVLTVTTGRLLTKSTDANNGIGDLYKILEHMTGDQMYTHSLPECGNECRPYLLEWFPELSKVDSSELDNVERTPEAVQAWVDKCKEELGLLDEYDVSKLPENVHKSKNPISDLMEKIQDKHSETLKGLN